ADHPDVVRTLVDTLGSHLVAIARAAGVVKEVDDAQVRKAIDNLLRRHAHSVGQGLFSTPGLCFAGTPGMSLERIRDEYELGRLARDLLESGKLVGTPLQLLQQMRAEINKTRFAPLLTQHASPLLQPASGQSLLAAILLRGLVLFTWPYLLAALLAIVAAGGIAWSQSGWFWGLVAAAFVASLAVLGFLALLGRIYATLRGLETTDVPDNSSPDPQRLKEVVQRENWTEQNHLFGIVAMKPGLVRNLVLRVVFFAIVTNASSISRPGFLGELGTIHFARWILLPGTNKLLFFSNYGGSWESYLEDFITKAHAGLTGVWSNTIGFPRTNNVFQDGATDGDRFKRWARRLQHPTRVWYSAYPHLTTARIRLNSAIRQGLASAATEDEAAQWLSCFGSRPRSGAIIENHDVQAILFGGMGYLNHSTCLLLRLPESVAGARRWLSDLAPRISFGDTPPPTSARIVALTQTGLRRLGCDDKVLGEFPIAFQEGMSTPQRAALLRDTGDDKPEHWRWGYGAHSVDVALLLYADSEERLAQEAEQVKQSLQQWEGALEHEILLAVHDPRKPTREPFGFVDGISQPIVRGTRRWIAESDANHVVEPGEFLLGYLDNRGYLPQTPTVAATWDPHNILPALTETQAGDLPDFAKLAANGPRDLGRNGSFLVIRQLEQDVELFNDFLRQTAHRLQGRSGVPIAFTEDQLVEWIGAKIIGRWRDGTSLVRFPHAPGSWENCRPDESPPPQGVPAPYPDAPGKSSQHQPAHKPDNSFLLGAEDPLGERCPYGAHIRRTNPRDSLNPNSMEQVAITNRHRILRVGRSYAPQQLAGRQKALPGLLFMCLNADIERQFEFVQQTWSGARLFHGLDGEVDPLLGRGGKGGRLTIPTAEGPLLVTGFKDFVRVRGGGYFFLPGRRALSYLAGDSTTNRQYRVEQVAPQPAGGKTVGDEAALESAGPQPPSVRPSWDSVH
ncbi:MAG: hypothetical protein L0211_23345, partial [Planctomycetaceae bacterium]|nr:hypothetical protein [Planctomycetaceae bacterium]